MTGAPRLWLPGGRAPPVEIDRHLQIDAPFAYARLLLDGPEAIVGWFPGLSRDRRPDGTVAIAVGTERRELLSGDEQWLPEKAALLGEDPQRAVRGFVTLREIIAEPGPHIATELWIHIEVLPAPGARRRTRQLRRLLDVGMRHLTAELGH